MTPINHWFAMVKEMMKSSLAPNVMFGFLLVCLEKFMEMEFECPCDPQLNVWLVTGCFCVPAIFIIVVMSSQGYKNRKCSEGWTEKVFIGFAQAILWLTLLFMDGNYLACAMTESSGEYVKAHEDASWKWCKPKNSTELVNTKKWFAVSKFIGLGFIVFLALATALYICCRTEENEENVQNEESGTMMGQMSP